ncbi:DUF899 domain-containing protein [Streptomyces sp. SID13031]|nr:DUF899 domain-containing protein [Streptomyces sp. SID13031]
MPPVTSIDDWATARALLLVEEKQATRTLDALAAKRRRLPMTQLQRAYVLHGPAGEVSFIELFGGRRQLIVYHFMYGAAWTDTCGGCSRRMDDVGRLDHLHARDTSFVAIAAAPYPKIVDLWTRKGWTVPVYSSHGSSFNTDMGVTLNGEENFGLSVYLRGEADDVYRTYFTSGRGVEPAGFRQLLDLTPYGRQEDWEDSPDGWPQSPTYGWGSERDE